MINHTCDACRWWTGPRDWRERLAKDMEKHPGEFYQCVQYRGQCRGGSPTGEYAGGFSPPQAIWPSTHGSDWCGRWEPVEVA